MSTAMKVIAQGAMRSLQLNGMSAGDGVQVIVKAVLPDGTTAADPLTIQQPTIEQITSADGFQVNLPYATTLRVTLQRVNDVGQPLGDPVDSNTLTTPPEPVNVWVPLSVSISLTA